jgi:hypothetical protein
VWHSSDVKTLSVILLFSLSSQAADFTPMIDCYRGLLAPAGDKETDHTPMVAAVYGTRPEGFYIFAKGGVTLFPFPAGETRTGRKFKVKIPEGTFAFTYSGHASFRNQNLEGATELKDPKAAMNDYSQDLLKSRILNIIPNMTDANNRFRDTPNVNGDWFTNSQIAALETCKQVPELATISSEMQGELKGFIGKGRTQMPTSRTRPIRKTFAPPASGKP